MQAIVHAMHHSGALLDTIEAGARLWESIPASAFRPAELVLCALLAFGVWRLSRKQPIYLCDFYCFHPPERLGASVPVFCGGMRHSKRWNDESLDFMDKVSANSGLGEYTYFPEGGP